MSIILEFADIFIHQLGGREKKNVSLKEFTLIMDKEVGESEAEPALG